MKSSYSWSPRQRTSYFVGLVSSFSIQLLRDLTASENASIYSEHFLAHASGWPKAHSGLTAAERLSL